MPDSNEVVQSAAGEQVETPEIRAAKADIVAEVTKLDPELMLAPETRRLVEVGAAAIVDVTDQFGTPHHPKMTSGTHEKAVLMTYHNGGRFTEEGGDHGYTSIGPEGVGVPRNVLVIAAAVNEAAKHAGLPEVYSAKMRAQGFAALPITTASSSVAEPSWTKASKDQITAMSA
ncbi:MAG TPA: hypothetical protein VLF67_03890 [Candidatus Saccharimonas sp.]|nr:hypothetical protein [Candidatus Saccharimonas sp.]